MNTAENKHIRVDIVSDVVCPWCVIGYKELERAVIAEGVTAEVFWHPFELNPHMPPEGQDQFEHIAQKYGATREQSLKAREKLTAHGAALGFTFNYSDASRMVNTFKAHQLLHWARASGRAHPLKMALFKAYFTEARDVSDVDTLLAIAEEAGLDKTEAARVLAEESEAQAVRAEQEAWRDRGIQGVPAMVFEEKHLIVGARGVEGYRHIIGELLKERAA